MKNHVVHKHRLATILEIKLGKEREDAGPRIGFSISLFHLCGMKASYQQRLGEVIE